MCVLVTDGGIFDHIVSEGNVGGSGVITTVAISNVSAMHAIHTQQ